jgi:hypothetical protein
MLSSSFENIHDEIIAHNICKTKKSTAKNHHHHGDADLPGFCAQAGHEP